MGLVTLTLKGRIMRTKGLVLVFLFAIFVCHPPDLFAQEPEFNIVLTPAAPEIAGQQKNQDEETLLKLQQILAWIANSKDPKVISGLHDLMKVFSEIQVHYVDPKSAKELIDLAIQGMVGWLDPNSNLYIDQEAQSVLGNFQEQNYGGAIGISIGRYGKEIYIIDVFEDNPAAKAGIEPGDIILSVDGKKVFGMDTTEVGELTKGKDGTSVAVEIRSRHTQKPRTYNLIRQEVKISSVVYKDLDRQIAYIRITEFAFPETTVRFYGALARASNKAGLINPLRDNGGGGLDGSHMLNG